MKIGDNIDIDHPLCLAPMEKVTDKSFRQSRKELGADIVYTEFTSVEAIKREVAKAMKKIDVLDQERPIGIQIYGGQEESFKQAIPIVEQLKPDMIDMNFGCWVSNHMQQKQCAALLRDLPLMERLIKAAVNATSLPVTIKTRLGWDENDIVILDVAKMAEQAGAKALTVHCRTRCQAYKGQADWTWLEKIKKASSIPLIGNGDITEPEDVKRMFDLGCDGVMIGRGAMQNPWIFKQAKEYLKTGKVSFEPDFQDRMDLCRSHLKLAVESKGERDGVIPFRKYYSGYLKGIPGVAILRADLMKLTSYDEVLECLQNFCDQYTGDEALV